MQQCSLQLCAKLDFIMDIFELITYIYIYIYIYIHTHIHAVLKSFKGFKYFSCHKKWEVISSFAKRNKIAKIELKKDYFTSIHWSTIAFNSKIAPAKIKSFPLKLYYSLTEFNLNSVNCIILKIFSYSLIEKIHIPSIVNRRKSFRSSHWEIFYKVGVLMSNHES